MLKSQLFSSKNDLIVQLSCVSWLGYDTYLMGEAELVFLFNITEVAHDFYFRGGLLKTSYIMISTGNC